MSQRVRLLKRAMSEFLYQSNIISVTGLRAYRAYHLLREHVIPSRRLARREDREFDVCFGVETSGSFMPDLTRVMGDNGKFAAKYRAVRPPKFRDAMAHFDIKHEEFVFIDFGSGMGRALLLASDYPFKRIIGVEFSPDLHHIAEENIRRYKSESQKCHAIESICVDAASFAIPEEKAVFYFFNPFQAEVMERVLENIKRSLEEFPRDAFFIYLNPMAIEVFDRFNLDRRRVFTSFKL